MTPVNPDNDAELGDPEVDISAMVAKVGAESVATVQAPTLRTRGQLRATRIARQHASGELPYIPLLQHQFGASDGGSDYVAASDSECASCWYANTRPPCGRSFGTCVWHACICTSLVSLHFTTCACCERH